MNGRTTFTIEYDRSTLVDTVLDSTDREVLRMRYNSAGQLLSADASSESGVAPVNITYSAAGRLSSLTWSESSRRFAYDHKNRVVKSELGQIESGQATSFSYAEESEMPPHEVQLPSGK